MQAVLLEDLERGRFGPLTLLRSQFELRCGVLELREKLELRRPDWTIALLPRPELAAVVAERHVGRGIDALGDGPTVALLGTVVVDDALLRAIEDVKAESLLATPSGEIVGAVLGGDARERLESTGAAEAGPGALLDGEAVEVPARTVHHPWELVAATAGEIAADAPLVPHAGEMRGGRHRSACLDAEENVTVGEGSELGANVVLDARRGPVVVGRDVLVEPNAVLAGPVAVGDGCIVRAGAVLHGGTSLGPVCRVGGEVHASVMQSHANKQHVGFLGHSYVGSWVNIGAGTNTSDLKNSYGDVRVELDREVIDTGSRSVGAVIGDHSKTAIGTRLNTGTVIGIFCSVFADGFPPKHVESFSWGTRDGFVRYRLDDALETARTVMARRGEALGPAVEARVRELHRAAD